jgi:hypothetical protein
VPLNTCGAFSTNPSRGGRRGQRGPGVSSAAPPEDAIGSGAAVAECAAVCCVLCAYLVVTMLCCMACSPLRVTWRCCNPFTGRRRRPTRARRVPCSAPEDATGSGAVVAKCAAAVACAGSACPRQCPPQDATGSGATMAECVMSCCVLTRSIDRSDC